MLASTLFWWFLAGFGVSFTLLTLNFFCVARVMADEYAVKKKNIVFHFVLSAGASLFWVGTLITGLIWFLTFLGVIHPTL